MLPIPDAVTIASVVKSEARTLSQEKIAPQESPLSPMPIAASITSADGPKPQLNDAQPQVELDIIKDRFTPPMATPQDDPEKEAPNDAETPRMVRGGGHSASLLAEDAADARALNQRFKMPGSEPLPEAEPLETLSTMAGAGAATSRTARRSPRIVYVLLALIVIIVVGVVTAPRWAPQIRNALNVSTPTTNVPIPTPAPLQSSETFMAPQARADDLAKDVAALNARLVAIEQRPATAGAAETMALEQRITALETATKAKSPDDLSSGVTNQARQLKNVSARIATLESAIGNVAKLEDVATRLSALEGKSAEANSVLALGERVTSIEKRDSIAATALVVATAQLRDAVRAGRPYSVELETVNQLALRANVVFEASALTNNATKGFTQVDALKATFPDMVAAAVRSAAVPGEAASWYRTILDRAFSIISIRPFGNVEGTTPGAIMARAEQALRSNNMAQAVREIETLSGPPASAAVSWLQMAKAYVTAERALDDLVMRSLGAMSAISQTKPTTPAP